MPLLLANKPLRSAVGLLFTWKMAILIAVIVASILIFRPFCRYLCPLGAFYSLFNPISFYRYSVDQAKCTRCGRCVKACPEQAISCGFGKEKPNQTKRVQSE